MFCMTQSRTIIVMHALLLFLNPGHHLIWRYIYIRLDTCIWLIEKLVNDMLLDCISEHVFEDMLIAMPIMHVRLTITFYHEHLLFTIFHILINPIEYIRVAIFDEFNWSIYYTYNQYCLVLFANCNRTKYVSATI